MSVAIDQVRPALAEEWDAIWRPCRFATYFHSREWAEIWNHYTPDRIRPNPLLVRFTDGKTALLPLSRKAAYFGYEESLVSSPAGTYGGWIAVDAIGREHAILMKEFLAHEVGPIYWQTNPYDDLVAAAEIDTNVENETHAIDLERGFDAVYADWAHQCRNSERKARRLGVRVKVGQTEEDWRGYYEVYEDTLRRWGTHAKSRYEWTLFREMFDRHSDHIKLWLATVKDDFIAAGVLVFTAGTNEAAWHSATHERYFSFRPMNLLYYEILSDACERAYKWFDFGSSAGLEGVRRFKETFGAKPLDCPVLYTHSQSAG